MKSTKFVSRYLLDLDRLPEGDDIDHIGSPGIAIYRFFRLVKFCPGGPQGRQNTEGPNVFVHRLAERDEIWQR